MTGERGKTELQLPAGKAAPRLARAFVRTQLPVDSPEWFSVTTLLLTSELVTLAVLHTTEPPTLRVEASDQALRITVMHACRATTRAQCLSEGDASGSRLVDSLAQRWEWHRAQDGSTHVWFTLHRDDELPLHRTGTDRYRKRTGYGRARW